MKQTEVWANLSLLSSQTAAEILLCRSGARRHELKAETFFSSKRSTYKLSTVTAQCFIFFVCKTRHLITCHATGQIRVKKEKEKESRKNQRKKSDL